MIINRNDRNSISATGTTRTARTAFIKPILFVAGAALVAGCTATGGSDTSTTTTTNAAAGGSAAAAASPANVSADLAAIAKKDVAKIAPTRLAQGLVPPTNRWFTGLVFGDQPLAVFPMPLSAALTDTGFALGLPTVT